MPVLAPTTDEVWSFNGTSLNMPFWDTKTFGGSRMSLPTLRGSDIEVPYKAGLQWRAKYPSSKVITLAMWTAGIDQSTGNPSTDQRLAFNNNFQQLRQLFWSRDVNGSRQGQLTRMWKITQGITPLLVQGTAMAEIAGSMEPTMTGRNRADFAVDLLLSDPYFYGVAQTQSIPYNSSTAVTNLGEGVAGEGFPSAVSSFTATFTGPLTSPLLTNSTAGVSVSLGLTLPAAYSVVLDFLNDTAIDSNGASQLGVVSHSGARMWMALLPGSNSLLLTSASSADTGNVQLGWSPPYL